MDKLTAFWEYLSEPNRDADFVDRLYFRFVPRILVIFATIIIAKEYGGNPIQCWANAEFTNAYSQYANDYCFVEGTYFVNVENELGPLQTRHKETKAVDYYPWLAFLLAFQAVIFYLPYFCWSAFNHTSGLAVRALISMANHAAFEQSGLESKDRVKIARHIYNSLRVLRRKPTTKFLAPVIEFYREVVCRYRLVAMYIGLKISFLVISIVQLKFISKFLGKSSSIWDFYSSIDALWNGQSWEKTGNFPRVGFCDFEIRDLEDNIQTYSLQCVLMANMLNEKIFVAVWFCLWIMTAIGTLNLVHWLITLFYPDNAFDFIHRAIFNGNSSNIARIHDEKNEKAKEHDIKMAGIMNLINDLNKQLVNANLPLKSIDQKKIKLEIEKDKAIREVDGNFKNYTCGESIYRSFLHFIGLDTVLLFKLMEMNSSAPIVNEILSQLFYIYVEKRIKYDENFKNVVEEIEDDPQLSVTAQSQNFLPQASGFQQETSSC